MAAVAEECKREQHHPEWSNVRVIYLSLLRCRLQA